MITKLDSYGSIEWQKFYGSPSIIDTAYSVTEASDGGYVFTGRCATNGGDVVGNHGNYDIWVVKLNLLGNIVWTKCLGGTADDIGYSIKTTSDGGYIIAGDSRSTNGDVIGNHGNYDFWIVKLNSNGEIIWQKSLGGSGTDNLHSIQQTNEGGYIVSGASYSNDGDVTINNGVDDFWVVKLSSTGVIEWQKSLGYTSNEFNPTTLQSSDGGYIIAGNSYSPGHGLTLVIKLDNLGNVQWERSYSGGSITSIIKTLDGGYAAVGTSGVAAGDIRFLKLDVLGNVEGERNYGTTGADSGTSIDQLPSGEYLLAGNISQWDREGSCNHSTGGSYDDGSALKLNANPLEIKDTLIENPIAIYPNPTNSEINVKVTDSLLGLKYTISDQAGRLVLQGTITKENTTIGVENLSSGFYIFSLESNAKLNAKIIKN